MHVTEMTNHDGGDGDDIVCDGYDIYANVISVTQNRDGNDRDGDDSTKGFSIIILNVDDS